jgi:hypothetical protein
VLVVPTGGGYSFIGGGTTNVANGQWSFVGGGNVNTASGDGSAVVGGRDSVASGENGTVAGDWVLCFLRGGNSNVCPGSSANEFYP